MNPLHRSPPIRRRPSVVRPSPVTRHPSPEPVTLHLPAGEVARSTLVVAAVALGLVALWLAAEVVALLLLAILVATAIEPLVNRLRRGPFSRGAGVLVVYTAIVAAIGLPAFLVAPSLAAQGTAFMESLPERAVQARGAATQLRPSLLAQAAVDVVDRISAELQSPKAPPGEQLVKAGFTAVQVAVDFVMVFILAFYWLLERAAIKRALLRLVPRAQAREVTLIWAEVEEKLGGWVRGQLVLVVTVGGTAMAGFALLGLPNPVLLGVVAGLGELAPLIGPIVAFAPAVLLALTLGLSKALLTLAYAVVIQQVESNFLVPRVISHTMGISPLTVLVGILVGAVLYGMRGALLAVPITAILQVVLAHILRERVQAERRPPH